MIIGIISAMDEELAILLKDMDVTEEKVKANMTFHKGKLWGKDVVAVVSGIGCRWYRNGYISRRCCCS